MNLDHCSTHQIHIGALQKSCHHYPDNPPPPCKKKGQLKKLTDPKVFLGILKRLKNNIRDLIKEKSHKDINFSVAPLMCLSQKL